MAQSSTSHTDNIPPGILLTSGLVHSFIQGIIVSQVGRYYEDYYHLDTTSMKTYVGSIVVISLYVCLRRRPSQSSRSSPQENSSVQTTYISYKAWVVILPSGGQNPAVAVTSPAAPTFLTPSVGIDESLDVSGPILERRSLRLVPYLPYQTVLESKRPTVLRTQQLNPSQRQQTTTAGSYGRSLY